jgi:SAM-dependent methyltransferase
MGYGLDIMRTLARPRRIVGVDLSAFACEIAQALHAADADSVLCRDAAQLPELADGSVDVIASFETIEHMPDPERLLATFRRILNPAGYLVASVPNRWVDETGKDPNPDHHQIFDWSSFGALLGDAGFEIVERYAQNCGGALKEPGRLRRFVPLDGSDDGESAEWCVVVARPILKS